MRVQTTRTGTGRGPAISHGQPITIDDLWGLTFGTAATGGTTTLLFSAGINDAKDGLAGSINAAG